MSASAPHSKLECARSSPHVHVADERRASASIRAPELLVIENPARSPESPVELGNGIRYTIGYPGSAVPVAAETADRCFQYVLQIRSRPDGRRKSKASADPLLLLNRFRQPFENDLHLYCTCETTEKELLAISAFTCSMNSGQLQLCDQNEPLRIQGIHTSQRIQRIFQQVA